MVSELCEGGDLRRLLYSVDERGAMGEQRERLENSIFNQLVMELFSGLVCVNTCTGGLRWECSSQA